ncbi:MAG: BlaI/MecI/CopY family transcriptional regulator [Phaeodactylibacter sp.]|nr:BlaI/MecI/CopY family transcriptional regulator [Phaeodactylibacter sp.]MCB9293047.1 BlaI/MecI/CopY family transcriptional regulator [Lewinellaceae bacterium]
MKKLTAREEEVMQVLWALERAFVKDIIEQLPEPRPHYNTVSTIVRLLEERGFVAHKAYGNAHQYFPMVTKREYTRHFMGDVLANYFDNSLKRMVAFFAEEEKLSEEELQEIINLIEKKGE